MRVTKDWIKTNASYINPEISSACGWNEDQLELLGVSWPPPKGWIERCIGQEISESLQADFESHRLTSPLMSKHRDLGWAWKGDDVYEQFGKSRRKIKRKERKRGKKMSRRQKLLHAPGYIFYQSKAWLRLRMKVLAEYGRKCMKCDAVGVEIHVDHIQPRSTHPHLSLSFSNLQVLCRDCNMEKSNLHSTDYRDESAGRDLDNDLLVEARKYV